jgi:hypothetical protein
VTRDAWLRELDALQQQARRVEQQFRIRLLDTDVSSEEGAAIEEALRHAIGLKRSVLRVIDRVCPVPAPVGVARQ